MGRKGIQMRNTKEAVVGFIAIAALLADAFKDGVQMADAMTIWAKVQANHELLAKITSAYQEIEQIPSEVKEVTAEEVLDIVAAILPELKNLLLAVKK
jgi:hypothetical protein